ncbi:uncharacterized protein EKO05_0009410 [Ascochyta rabiei]|nr:uncharacterized protein EKO05_0009410 [Ascochyta rabiei]UPX19138.1 hypothetical protein EKO05_0009410 [Ascochyta rabiei]
MKLVHIKYRSNTATSSSAATRQIDLARASAEQRP